MQQQHHHTQPQHFTLHPQIKAEKCINPWGRILCCQQAHLVIWSCAGSAALHTEINSRKEVPPLNLLLCCFYVDFISSFCSKADDLQTKGWAVCAVCACCASSPKYTRPRWRNLRWGSKGRKRKGGLLIDMLVSVMHFALRWKNK